MPVLIAAVAMLGLAIGSFLNVVVYRVPAGKSLLRPGSHCPECESAIRARHNIPLLGWIVLRGRCADCAAPISVRYPLVECVTTGLFVATTVRMAQLHLLSALPAYLFFVAVGVALTAIDLDVKRLPNAIVLPSYAVLATLLSTAAIVNGTPQPILRAAIGSAALFAFYLVLALIHPSGMGFGDVKFAGVIGGALGFLSYSALIVGAFVSFVLGGFVAAALVLSRRAGGKSALPFGPAMAAGAFIAIFAAPVLSHTYLQLAHHQA